MSIKNWKTTPRPIVENDPEIKKLLPTVFTRADTSFEVVDANPAVPNAIRRVLLGEIPVKILTFEYDAFSTTNDFSLVDLLQSTIMGIKIDQSLPVGATFQLHYENKTDSVQKIYSRDIKPVGKLPPPKFGNKGYFDETYIVEFIEPGRAIHIDKITVTEDTGMTDGNYNVVARARSIPLDITPRNSYRREGVPTSQQSGMHHRVTFRHFGNADPKELVRTAINICVKRLSAIVERLGEFIRKNNEYELLIEGENDTTGQLIMRGCLEAYPDGKFVICCPTTPELKLKIRILTDSDPEEIVKTGIQRAISQLQGLKV